VWEREGNFHPNTYNITKKKELARWLAVPTTVWWLVYLVVTMRHVWYDLMLVSGASIQRPRAHYVTIIIIISICGGLAFAVVLRQANVHIQRLHPNHRCHSH
jgi:hypothetical protein